MAMSRFLSLGLTGLALTSADLEGGCLEDSCSNEVDDEQALMQLRGAREELHHDQGLAQAKLSTAMGPYLNYDGPYHVQGQIAVMSTGLLLEASHTLSWRMWGLDPRCTQVGTKSNSCGIHIHEGTSCSENAGGHYFKAAVGQDPWKVVTYKTCLKGTSLFGSHKDPILTGYNGYDIMGHTLVVHDYEGSRISCGILSPTLRVPDFMPYLGYQGDLKSSGMVSVEGGGALLESYQSLSWKFKSLDPRCDMGPDKAKANSCGLHIHAGTSCIAPAGGHYYDKPTAETPDPWMHVFYTARGHRQSSRESDVRVVTGFTNVQVNGHAFILHDHTGDRVACGLLATAQLTANTLVPYFNYGGDLKVSGWISLKGQGVADTAAQVLSWKLTGADSACATAPGPSANMNACGIHIHRGMSCSEDAKGHFYDVAQDPWLQVKYRTIGTRASTSSHNVEVVTGLSNFDVQGHTMIVHDAAGKRIACGILAAAAYL